LPDTEIVFDENDHYFFSDRGGFIYALDKKTANKSGKIILAPSIIQKILKMAQFILVF
jgi:hypothetical protein